jgi:flagellar hook-associated protein 1 FlgK
MGDMLSSATSGLLAFQRALDTTSHNIANVNTDGFSRQRVQIGTRMPQSFSTGFVGSGSSVRTVERLYDRFVAEQTRIDSSQLSRLNTYSAQADILDNLFADDQIGLSASLQKFINAFQDVANSPSSIPARQVVLAQAESFRDRLQSFDTRLQGMEKDLNSRLTEEAQTVTSLAKNIADLNRNISIDQARTGQPPNDLLDQRDRLLDQLATHVNLQVSAQDDGSVLVSIGGQPLVVGNQSASLVTIPDAYDASRYTLAVQNLTIPVDVGTRLSGGSLGGLLDFRRDLLDTTRNSLGRLSIALAEQVNTQNRAGIDLNGNFGQDVFAVGGVETLARSNNAGTGTVAVTRQQPSASTLTEANYTMSFTGTGWALTRADTGASVTMTGAGTAGSPFLAGGMSIVVGGTPTVGDSFLVRPTRAAVAGMNMLITDPELIAAAAPISTSTATANRGNGSISAGEVTNVANGALLTPVSLVFDSATTYQINGVGASIPYTAGANINLNGWRVVISGAPAVGDTFSIGPNNNPAGDNRNALKLTEALAASVMDGGTTSLNAGAGRLVGRIGVAAGQAQANRDAQQAIYEDDIRIKDSVSGVNLDEEAGNLLRFQQAYQAAAQAIKIADTLFQTVLEATRR